MRSFTHAFMCLIVATVACASDPARDPAPAAADGEATEISEELATAPPQSLETDTQATNSQDATTALTACAHVVWCDQPGSTGTVCQQDGCSVSDAKSECISDLGAIGCTLHCPAYIQLSGGGRSCICSAPGTCTPGCPC